MSSLSVSASGAAADAIATARADPRRRPRRQPALRPGPHPVGSGRRVRVADPAVAGWACPARRAPSSVRSPRCATSSREQGLDHVVLCGMGGSSLAPEVICATAGKPLVVLDSSDPDYVRRALGDDLDAHRRRRLEQVRLHGRDRLASAAPTSRRSPTPASTRRRASSSSPTRAARSTSESRARRATASSTPTPTSGGRYSALTAFGLVPERPRRRRHRGAARRRRGGRRPARRRRRRQPGAAPRRRHGRHRARCATSSSSSTTAPASSASPTGPSSSSPSPPARTAPASCPSSSAATTTPRSTWPAADVTVVRLVSTPTARRPPSDVDRRVRGPRQRRPRCPAARSGRCATAVAGRLLGINPFDQPDVESAKKAARAPARPGTGPSRRRPPSTDGAVEIRALGAATGSAAPRPSRGAVDALFAQLDPEHGYVAVMAYLDRLADADLADVRACLAAPHRAPDDLRLGPAVPALDRPVPQGRPGRRRLPADHRRRPARTSPIPGRDVHLRRASSPAQAGGDAQVLADARPPVLPLHLTDHDAGLAQAAARPLLAARALHEPGAGRAGHNPLRDPARPAPPPHRRPVRPGDLRGDRRPGPQEADAGRSTTSPTAGCCRRASRSSASPGATGPTRTSARSSTTPSAARPHARSARRCGAASPRASGSCRARSTTPRPSTCSPRPSTSSTRSAAPAATTPSTCRSRRASSPRSASSSSGAA